ncbi:MAG: serine hydrolase domain-containing protein [Luteimonas sp.]
MAHPVFPASPGRRRFLAAGSAVGIAGLAPWVQAVATACGPADAGRSGAWIPSDALLAQLPVLMAAFSVPGLGIAVVDGGTLAWSRTFGVTNALRGTPTQPDTVFEDASLSKPVFAYLVLQLVDQGVLDLDRPLVQYRRPDYLADTSWTDRITARDVLRHSTGLPNWRKQPAQERLAPTFAPGTAIGYSGEAFFWLQLVVETLTGESLDESMQARLFGPAGMADSSFAWDDSLAARSTHGHGAAGQPGDPLPAQMLREQWTAAQRVADRWGKPLSAWQYADAARALPEVLAVAQPGLVAWPGDIMANAAASLRTTVQDYARFMALLMAGRPRAPWQLEDATRRAMLTPQLVLPGRWTQKGLGWGLEDTRDGPVFYHAGSNGGIFKNFAMGDAQRGRAIVVLTNADGGGIVYRRIIRAASGHDLLAFDL